MATEQQIERLARMLRAKNLGRDSWDWCDTKTKERWKEDVRAVLAAIEPEPWTDAHCSVCWQYKAWWMHHAHPTPPAPVEGETMQDVYQRGVEHGRQEQWAKDVTEMLNEITGGEWGTAAYSDGAEMIRAADGKCYLSCASVNGILAARRAKYAAPAKSAEERVTVYSPHGYSYSVRLDGQRKFEFINAENAEIYRLGLIAKLKADAGKGE